MIKLILGKTNQTILEYIPLDMLYNALGLIALVNGIHCLGLISQVDVYSVFSSLNNLARDFGEAGALSILFPAMSVVHMSSLGTVLLCRSVLT